MTAVALFEAKNRLSELVDRVLTGEVIEITRYGKVVARLAPPEDDVSRLRSAQDAVMRLQAASRWVPNLWLAELANLLRGAQRRRRITASQRAELAAAAAALRLQVCRDPADLLTLDKLAADHDLSTYDACYLELALRRGIPLATIDRALLAAMQRCGVPAALLPT